MLRKVSEELDRFGVQSNSHSPARDPILVGLHEPIADVERVRHQLPLPALSGRIRPIEVSLFLVREAREPFLHESQQVVV